MAEDRAGIVVDVEDNYTIIWSFTDLVLYAELHTKLANKFKRGDCISLKTFDKIDRKQKFFYSNSFKFKVEVNKEVKDKRLQLEGVDVHFRMTDGKLYGYSPILGEIAIVSECYESSLGHYVSVPAIWDRDLNRWTIPIFNPKMCRLNLEGRSMFKSCEPCRGIVFRNENGSFVVWSEHHGISELNLELSENANQQVKPQIGSFLRIRVTKRADRVFPLVREYKVIDPFFAHRLNVTGNGRDNFSVMTEADFDPRYNEIIDGQCVYYVKSKFFGKIYDNMDDTRPLIKPNTKGSLQVWLRAISDGKILLVFQLAQVQNLENTGRPAIYDLIQQENVLPPPTRNPQFTRTIFMGFIYRVYPVPTVYCLNLKEDVVLPNHISEEKPYGYWTGKWLSFCLDEARNGRNLVLCEPTEIDPWLPTRIDRFGNPEIFVHLETRNHNANPTQVFCQELEIPVDDLQNCCLGTGVYCMWIQRTPTDSVRWRISPSEQRDGFRKPESGFVNSESCRMHLAEMASPSWLKSKQLRIWPHPYEQAYIEQQREQNAPKMSVGVSPEYCTGFVCTGSLSVYCLEKRKEYVLNDDIVTVPREDLIGKWVHMTIVKQQNWKEEVVHVAPRTNWDVYPARVVNGIPEMQIQCIYSPTENGHSQLFCPLLGMPVSDPFSIIKTEGSHKLWITRKKGHELAFTVSQSELDSKTLKG